MRNLIVLFIHFIANSGSIARTGRASPFPRYREYSPFP